MDLSTFLDALSGVPPEIDVTLHDEGTTFADFATPLAILIGAVVAALYARYNHSEVLREERLRLGDQLAHDRQMRDRADTAAVLDDALLLTSKVVSLVHELRSNWSRLDESADAGRTKRLVTEHLDHLLTGKALMGESQAIWARLQLRFPPQDEMSLAFTDFDDKAGDYITDLSSPADSLKRSPETKAADDELYDAWQRSWATLIEKSRAWAAENHPWSDPAD